MPLPRLTSKKIVAVKVGTAAVLAVSFFTILLLFTVSSREAYRGKAEAILSGLNPQCLGCGPISGDDQRSIPHAMAFAMIASASARLHDERICKIAADWLVEHATPGWGLGYKWDAFNDGSINPTETIYGVTVALGVR